MSMQFWLALVVMAGLAICFVLYPVVFHREPKGQAADRRAQNLLAYRSRLTELEAERDQGRIDDAEFAGLKAELDRTLLDDVPENDSRGAVRGNRRLTWLVAILAVVAVPLVAFSLYGKLGAVNKLAETETIAKMQSGNLSPSDLDTLLEQLRSRLQDDPTSIDGWVLLGRSYMSLERYQEAAWAFEQLATQVAQQESAVAAASAWGLAAQAQFFASGEKMSDAVQKDIDRARKANPDEINALGLLGIAAFENRNYEEAIRFWRRILEVSPNHPQARVIREGVARAYQALGKPVPPELTAQAAAPAPPVAGQASGKAAGTGPRMTVAVHLAPQYQGKLPAQATVFVYAKAVQGPPMPLAVARYQVSDLPVQVTLDDSMAMAPIAKLSNADQVQLIARVSPSGSALPASGDWIGQVGPLPVRTTTKPINVTIDHQVP